MSSMQEVPNSDRHRRWAQSFLKESTKESEQTSDPKSLLINFLKRGQPLEKEDFAAFETVINGASLMPVICEQHCRNIDEAKLANFVEAATTFKADRLTGFLQSDADELYEELGLSAQKRLRTFCEALGRVGESTDWHQEELELLGASLRIATSEPQKRPSIRSKEKDRIIDLGFAPKSIRKLKAKIKSVLRGSVELAEPLFHCLETSSNTNGESELLVASPVKANAVSSIPYSPNFGKSAEFERMLSDSLHYFQWILPIAGVIFLVAVLAGGLDKKTDRKRSSPSIQQNQPQDVSYLLRDALVMDDDKAAEKMVQFYLALVKNKDKSTAEAFTKSRAIIKKMKRKWRDEDKSEDEVRQLTNDFVDKLLLKSGSTTAQEKPSPIPESGKSSP